MTHKTIYYPADAQIYNL